MDALAKLKEEIAKKRKHSSSAAGTENISKRPQKRWRSRLEIEKERESQYFAEELAAQERRSQKRRTQDREVREEEVNTASRSLLHLNKQSRSKSIAPETPDTQKEKERPDNSSREPPLSKPEVVKQLRVLKQPATLFGEDDWDRFNRLRDFKLSAEEHSDGQKNFFQTKLREVQAKDAEEDTYQYARAQLPNQDRRTANEDEANEQGVHGDGEVVCKEDYVYRQIRKLARLWHSEIEAMSKEERRTNKGRSLIVTYEQTKHWLEPLERLLKKRKLSQTILDALNDIFKTAERREYMQAIRLYLERLAIGNAPWPMGATQVGIHSRAAREKIGEDKIAHVMNDEQSRKYIQAVKRLLTVAQRHMPTDVSKMITS